ncbi:penicillin-binding protein [Rhodohalobacter halophilus]|uniref:penicillin-binding protein n=1 Tax=Rhodohalobacter halophilus TaxID=1812810 RepID=UPI00083FC549|nr:penicillin-binding protein [Rhodohalobacter halophilus]
MNVRSAIMGRMFLLLGLLFLLPAAILMQIFRVNLLEGDGLKELWSQQAIDTIPISAQRGNIFDANGSLLATNSINYKVAVDPLAPTTTRDQLNNVAQVLSRHTGRSASYYQNVIRNASNRSRYIVLERSIPVSAYDDLKELGYRTLILEEEYRRNYNFGSLSAHTLGFVNHNIDGMSGLESSYNSLLKGTNGLQQVRKDRSNRIFAYVGAPQKQPEQGLNLHTTIDAYIQAITEEELEAGIKRHMAKYGTAIVMDPKTGAIKALANYPTFNPNAPSSIDSENRRNYAVSDMIEPGSTFKLVTAIAAVEQGVVDFDEIFETPENGRKMIHGQMMRDHDPLGSLDFKGVIAKSSNIATSEIALRLKPETLYQYARNMGFGTLTNIDLPSEMPGRLQKPFEWSRVTQPWMSIGYEVQATPIQMVQAYGAFANGGKMMRPYVVDRITDEFGNVIRQNRPNLVRRIAKPSTIEKLLPIFEEVVSDSGTAEWAEVEGLRIAGKTGTAQKLIDGRYQAAYRASFAGFFPADDPQYVLFVLLDEPRTSIYGGFTAGSIFKEIATRIAGLDNDIHRSLIEGNYATVPSDSLITPKVEGLRREYAKLILNNKNLRASYSGSGDYVMEQFPPAGEKIAGNTSLNIKLGTMETDSIPDGFAQIPDLLNMNMRQATTLLLSRGLDIEMIGSGTIYTQFPRAGDLMRKGRTVTVRGKARPMQQATTVAANN